LGCEDSAGIPFAPVFGLPQPPIGPAGADGIAPLLRGRPQEAVGPNPLPPTKPGWPQAGAETLPSSASRTAAASAGGFATGREDWRYRL
jgi:hypothetical protein